MEIIRTRETGDLDITIRAGALTTDERAALVKAVQKINRRRGHSGGERVRYQIVEGFPMASISL